MNNKNTQKNHTDNDWQLLKAGGRNTGTDHKLKQSKIMSVAGPKIVVRAFKISGC